MPRGGYRAGAGRPRKNATPVSPKPTEAASIPGSPPTEKQQVEALAGFGLIDEEIAHVLGITVDALQKKYGPEILKGPPQCIANVARSLYKKATDPDKPDVNACIFWLRTRAGWNDKGESGKKEKKADAAKRASSGKFAPSSAPGNVIAMKKR